MKKFLSGIKNKLFKHYEWVVDFTEFITHRDIKKSRWSAAFAYVLFFVPLVMTEESQYGRFHANQSLINLLLSTIGAIIWSLIPFVGPILMVLQEVLCVVWMVRGFVLALQGKAKSIPLVGWLNLIAYRYPEQQDV